MEHIAVLLVIILCVLRLKSHTWVKINPHTRTCIKCDRQEDYFVYYGEYGKWEEMREGVKKKCWF